MIYNINKSMLLEEANRFEKYIKSSPAQKQIETFAKNNVYRSNNIAPVNPYYSNNNKIFTNLIHKGRSGENVSYNELLKADRNLKREQFSNLDNFYTPKTIEQRYNKILDLRKKRALMNTSVENRFGQYDKNIDSSVMHGGGKYYLEGLLKGNSTMKGYNLEHNTFDKGIQVTPPTKLGNTMPASLQSFQSSIYAARGPFINGDLPAKLSGNIKTDYLNKGGIDAEASILTNNLKHLKNITLEPFNYKKVQPDINELRSGPFNINQYAYNIPYAEHQQKHLKKNIYDNKQ